MLGFAKKESYGLHILNHQIRLVGIKNTSKGVTMKLYHSELLAPGAILNGRIINESAVSESIGTAARKMGIPKAGLHLSIPTSSTILRKSVFPVLNDKELRNLIDVELNSSSQMPFKDPVFDFVRLGGESVKQTQKQEEVLIFASPSNVVESYVRVVRQAGLKPLSVELAPLASLRLLLQYSSGIKARLPQCFIVINTEAAHLEFSIFVDGVPVFLHTVQDVSPGDSYAQNLAAELSRIIYYFTYSISVKQEEIQEIYLLGDQERLSELPAMIREVYSGQLRTIPLEAWLNAQYNSIQSYAVPIGLALKGA